MVVNSHFLGSIWFLDGEKGFTINIIETTATESFRFSRVALIPNRTWRCLGLTILTKAGGGSFKASTWTSPPWQLLSHRTGMQHGSYHKNQVCQSQICIRGMEKWPLGVSTDPLDQPQLVWPGLFALPASYMPRSTWQAGWGIRSLNDGWRNTSCVQLAYIYLGITLSPIYNHSSRLLAPLKDQGNHYSV